ncbi:glycosyl transferase family protein [Alkalimarinus sediminis]|uniref:Glycosyl transferase family protein n=1 Tax=Alkalimarinus sediminis TaxID=1632866 RepID=A0A9E8HNB5_9ALTE|nr:glycosyl transferase family protein [Alkalimarinus sediminis]UZW76096.1 glycosyl transferase family protein [Alkalimarinus sediminis]
MKMNKPKNYEEHPFAEYVRILGKGKKGSRSLTEEEAFAAMSMILDNKVEDLQLGAFLMLLRVKEESPQELSGFVKATKTKIDAPDDINVELDWSSYAGKRRHPAWYLFAALCLAEHGMSIFMHGASGHTADRMYTEDVLAELGVSVSTNWEMARTSIAKSNFCYMPLASLSSRMDEMINMRPVLGLRSPVHSLSRLINPLNASTVLQGIFHPAYSTMHQEAGQLLGYKNIAVIKGEGGEIERNPDAPLEVLHSGEDGLSKEVWPKMFEKRHVKADNMSVEYMKGLWGGVNSDEYAEGAIVGTMALALKLTGRAQTQPEAIELAQHQWKSRDKSRFN